MHSTSAHHPSSSSSSLNSFLEPEKIERRQPNMYPSSNHQRPMGSGGQGGLTRFVSAPGSMLTNLVDSVIGNDNEFSNVGSESLLNRYLSGDASSLTTESSCKQQNGLPDPIPKEGYNQNERGGGGGSGTLQRSYGFNQIPDVGVGGGGGASSSSPLIRHRSSPAGFFNQLNVENGFSITKGIGGGGYKYSHAGTNSNGGHGRLNTQLSFTRQDSLSQISEVGESVVGVSNSDDGHGNAGQSYVSGSFTMGPWDDSNEIVFSNPSNKRAKNINGDIITGLSDIESQSLFNLPKTSSEMANMEKLLQMQSDSVPCRIRAKRGFATHPRSIAERERRGRISDNLRKLQELVPNMDKQTSTSDMLDLAVQHIKGLQGEVQKLNKDIEKCTCGCNKQAT